MKPALALLCVFFVLGHAQNMPKPGQCGISPRMHPGERIVNGENAPEGKYCWQALLVVFFPNGTAKSYCGASFVKDTHALTAAHCVKGEEASNIRLYPGIHQFTNTLFTTEKERGIPCASTLVHESYAPSGLNNDVAICRLSRPVEIDNNKVCLLCLPEKGSPECVPGTDVIATGWGATTGNRSIPSRPVQLQQVQLKVVANTHPGCKPLTHVLGIFEQKSKMCAYEEWKSVCFGDSGGPLIRCNQKTADGRTYCDQCGIMSGTIDCSLTKPSPDVYARVHVLLDWILKAITKTL